MNALISSQEVASLLQVTETTVKRWANGGDLPCHKTLGGHRKYALNEVLQFAELRQIKISGVIHTFPEMQQEGIDFAIAAKNYNTISNFFLKKSLDADTEGLSSLLLYIVKHNIAFSTITDEIVRPALVRIGFLWSEGKLEINQERRATNTINEALIRLFPVLHKKPDNHHVAVCACIENELHEIGLRAISYTLESEGWKTHLLGANTPFETLKNFVQTVHPHLVCLSFTLVKRKQQLLDEMQKFGKFLKRKKIKFVVGGFYAGMFTEQQLGCDHILLSANDIVSFSKNVFQLKTGPKTKTK